MKTLEYRSVDKSGWPDGPWKNELDKKQWQDPETGLPCLIVRGPMGVLCGYVGVPRSHPCYGAGYEDVDVAVHGGLTFANRCSPGPESHGICHKVEPGEDDDVWWLGFDTGHLDDLAPYMVERYRTTPMLLERAVYRDLAYVEAEVASLARQLKALAG